MSQTTVEDCKPRRKTQGCSRPAILTDRYIKCGRLLTRPPSDMKLLSDLVFVVFLIQSPKVGIDTVLRNLS